MNYKEILEACWTGYQQQGMKKKGDRMVPNCVKVSEEQMEEDLKKWFKEKWVRFGPDGKIRGDCARGSSKEGKPKCLPQSKAHALGKKGRASAAAKKRREDPNPERRGPARNVATRVREQGVAEGWSDAIVSRRTGTPRTPYSIYIKGRKWKDFENDDHAEAVANKLRAKFKQEGKDPSVITIAATGYDKDIEEAGVSDKTVKQLQGLFKQAKAGKLKSDGRDFTKGDHWKGASPDDYGYTGYQGHGMPVDKKKPVKEQHDWDDADEFGMPGSEFFPDDDRLRDGDYVRDRQDGEYGEIFRMSGDPSERRVRILDRDGKGWYISPERLVAVDRDDPDIMRYFGKRRQRDMDEGAVSDALSNYLQVTGENDVEAVKAAIQKIARDPGLRPQSKARLLGQVGTMINKHRLPIGREYYQYMQKFMEAIATESRGGNYEQLGLRKSTADRYAVLDRTLDSVIMTTNDLAAAKQEAIEWADYDDIKTEIIDQKTGKKIFAVNGNAGAIKYLDEKQDACYRKVKSRYKVWPSAYASGALVQCRKKGAANWGNKKK